jgi:hypothetical protein
MKEGWQRSMRETEVCHSNELKEITDETNFIIETIPDFKLHTAYALTRMDKIGIPDIPKTSMFNQNDLAKE